MPFTPPLQTAVGSNGSPPWTLAFPNPVVSGDLLIIVGSDTGAGHPTLTPTDTLGNTYLIGASQDDISGAGITMWYAFSIAGGSNTVTFPAGAGSTHIAIIAEYNLNGVLDQTAHTTNGLSGISVTTTKPTELIVAACINGLQPTTWGVSGGFTKETQVDASVPQPASIVLVDMDAATVGTYTATFTQSPSFSADAVMLSFYASIPATVPGKIIVTTPVPPAPVIAADLHGLAMAYLTSKSGNKPILQCAFTNDLQNFQSWLFFTMWDWGADTGPPPPDLSIASGIGGMWLTWDFVEICCGRGYLSVTGKANLGSPATPSANQQMYVGIIQWNSVQVP